MSVMESTNKERSDAIALFEQEEASLQETTGKPANVPVPDDTDAVINGIVEEFFAAGVPVDEIPALTPRVKAILFHPSKFLRMGATVQDLCQRLRSVLRILNSNKGEDGEELSWTELEALVPLTDAELFADRVTAARLKSLARSLRVPAVVVAMAEAGVGGVLRPPHFRVRPFLHQSSSAGSQAKKVKEEFGGQLAIILIGKPGCGKTPVLKTMSGPLDENFSWPEPLLVLKQGPPKKQKVKPDVVRDSETLKVCPIYREAMNATTTGVHASEHGHILKIEDEYVNNNKAVRKDPLASGGGSMDNYKKETAELLNFHTPPTGGGGSSGKLVDNTFKHPNGLLAAITTSKTKYYLYDDSGGQMARLLYVHIPDRRLQAVQEADDDNEHISGDEADERFENKAAAEKSQKDLHSQRYECDQAYAMLDRKYREMVCQYWTYDPESNCCGEEQADSWWDKETCALHNEMEYVVQASDTFLAEDDRAEHFPKKFTENMSKVVMILCVVLEQL